MGSRGLGKVGSRGLGRWGPVGRPYLLVVGWYKGGVLGKLEAAKLLGRRVAERAARLGAAKHAREGRVGVASPREGGRAAPRVAYRLSARGDDEFGGAKVGDLDAGIVLWRLEQQILRLQVTMKYAKAVKVLEG